MGEPTLLLIINILAVILIALLGWLGNGYFKNIRDDINEQKQLTTSINLNLTQLNSRAVKMETWQEQHQKNDDERHESTIRWLDSLSRNTLSKK